LKQATPNTAQKATTAVGLLNPALAIPTLINIAVNPAMRPVVGAGVQMLNPAKHTLEIWKPVQDALAAGETALRTRSAAKALKELAVGKASFVKASEQLTAFQNGTELAGRKAQLLIGATAVLTALTALLVFSASGAAAGAGAGATAGAGASTQVQVRVAAEGFKDGVTQIVLAESPEAFDAGVRLCTEDAPRAALQMVMRRP
jgi:hypothetical protein